MPRHNRAICEGSRPGWAKDCVSASSSVSLGVAAGRSALNAQATEAFEHRTALMPRMPRHHSDSQPAQGRPLCGTATLALAITALARSQQRRLRATLKAVDIESLEESRMATGVSFGAYRPKGGLQTERFQNTGFHFLVDYKWSRELHVLQVW